MNTKLCPKCEKTLSLSAYSKGRGKLGTASWCKSCTFVRRKELRASGEYAIKDRAYALKWQSERDMEEQRLLWKYGITRAQRDSMIKAQNYCCKICGERKQLVVDHIHNSDPVIVRGMLCNGCNTAIGKLKDNPEILLIAASYVALKGN